MSANGKRQRLKATTELSRNYDTQRVINALLFWSLSNLDLGSILRKTLKEILSIPWLSFQSTGSIFLVENEPDVLVMKAFRGIDKHLLKQCQQVKFGNCLCGLSAKKKKVVFTNRITRRHTYTYRGMQPHGHYCIPIKVGRKIFGVINLYLKPGHRQTAFETKFLTAIANTLAGIIQHRKAEQKLKQSTRALSALSACNHALIHAQDEKQLLNEVCRIIVEIGGYRLAWVCKPQFDKNKSVISLSHAGISSAFIKQARLTWSADSIRGRGVIGCSIRSKKIQLGNDYLTEKKLSPWKKMAQKMGYRSVIALPLRSNGQHYGSLAIYHSEPSAFTKQEIKLLSELADDLAFGMYTLKMKKAHQLAEEELTKSNELLEKAFANTHFLLVYLDTKFNIIRCNIAFSSAKGYSDPASIVGKNLFNLFPHTYRQEEFQQVLKNRKPYSAHAQALIQDVNGQKTISYWDWSLHPIKDHKNKLAGLLLTAVDVSEKVLAEEKLLESYKHLGLINRQISILLDLNKQSGGENTKDILRYIINSTLNLSRANVVALYKYNDHSQTLTLHSSSEKNKISLAEKILIRQFPFLLPVVNSSQRIQGFFQENTKIKISNNFKLRYFLFLPLTINKKVRGVLFLGFDKKDCLTTQELEFYEAFISQASFVLQDLNLLDKNQ